MHDSKYSQRTCPLSIASALVMLAVDWLVYAINVATWGFEFWAVNLGGAALACVLAATAEGSFDHSSVRGAWGRGLAVGALVAIPLPVVGSVAAVLVLGWQLVIARARRRAT